MSSAELPLSFQDMILTLHAYWSRQGCAILQPYDVEVGAGTLHPATVLRALGPKPWNAAYVQPSRRPSDGRYGENPNRLQHYYQYQVILKPNPPDMQDLYLGSLAAIGLDPTLHDIRFVEDDWENPTVGAWGLGWEVWCDGMEVSQYTYFQQVGGLDVDPVAGELTYGLERLCMYVQGVDNVYDLPFNTAGVKYGEVFLENERQQSAYNFEAADLLEVGVLADLHPVAPDLPAQAPGPDGGIFPVVLDEADVVQGRIEADGAQRPQVEVLHVGRVRLQDHLVLVIVLQPVGVLAVAPVGGAARGLHIGRPPGLGPEGPQHRGRMQGAGPHLHVMRLQDQAAAIAPIAVQRQDQVLERQRTCWRWGGAHGR